MTPQKYLAICLVGWLFATLLAASGQASHRPAGAQESGYEPVFTPVGCPPQLAGPRNMECGTVTVPENREQPAGNQVQLAVFRIPASGQNPKSDALVYLPGGPGAYLSDSLGGYEAFLGRYDHERDVFLYDPRGAGLSSPALNCDAFWLAFVEALGGGFALEESIQQAVQPILNCYAGYRAEGIDPNHYRVADHVADLNDIRQALGYEQINIYGISYGTRLALSMAREHPATVRSLILDSVLPPPADLFTGPPETTGAVQRLFDLCAADEDCKAAYPELPDRLADIVERLAAQPLEIALRHPVTRQEYSLLLDERAVLAALFFSLYDHERLPDLPFAIAATHAGDTRYLERFILPNLFYWDGMAMGMHFAVWCNDEIPFHPGIDAPTEADLLDPQMGPFVEYMSGIYREVCAGWETGPPDPTQDEPVASAVPALLISGELDPVTPPLYGELAAATLPNSRHYVIPGAGHGISASDFCVQMMLGNFLDDPSSEAAPACLAALARPDFTIRRVDRPE